MGVSGSIQSQLVGSGDTIKEKTTPTATFLKQDEIEIEHRRRDLLKDSRLGDSVLLL